MPNRNIELNEAPPFPHYVGDGFRVHNFIPGVASMQRMNPFIMLDYNSPFYFEPSDKPRGVGVHPHRGFETVTIAYKGKVAHHDSTGNSGIIEEGDVQWMTAASGILHKEFHEENFSKMGGEFQMVQLWVNLPAKHKMSPPKYQSILNQSIPKVELPENSGLVEVIAGEYQGTKGAASTFSPIHLFNTKLNVGAMATFSFPKNYNTALLIIEGKIKVNGTTLAESNHFVLMENQAENFDIAALENSIVLILSGEPIQEPIAAHGPFVMNTRQELVQAFQDFQHGKFGHLAE